MNVLVTVLALGWRCLEVNIGYLDLEVWRLMTVDAGGRAVSPEQSELRFGMIKPRKFLP